MCGVSLLTERLSAAKRERASVGLSERDLLYTINKPLTPSFDDLLALGWSSSSGHGHAGSLEFVFIPVWSQNDRLDPIGVNYAYELCCSVQHDGDKTQI